MEVEVKAKLKNLLPIREKLESLGAKFSEPVEQSDAYFKPAGFGKKPDGPGSWIMRIRTSNGKSSLTFKALTEILGAWKEFETGIENAAQTRNMLEAMGLVNAFNINKKRTYGELDGFELCLDDVKELGYYLEVALESEEKEASRNKIICFLKKISVSEKDIEKRGYGEIIGEKLGHKFEGMR